MKNIIICGLVGTGKTTLAKKISKECGYDYIDLNSMFDNKIDKNDKILASKILANDIDNLLNRFDNCVIDCEYLILPEQYMLYNNKEKCEIIYLGFNDVDINILFNKFVCDYKNKNIKYDSEELFSSLKYFKVISKKVYNDCNKYNLKFFDICKDKNIVIQEVYEYILKIICS